MHSELHRTDSNGRPTLRNWDELMKPERLAAIQPSRLSRTRALLNRMIRERWEISCERFDVDAEAQGTVIYSIRTPKQEFSFIAFSLKPSHEGRTGRIIGRAWDMMGTLNEGPVSEEDVESARRNLPLLYRGRATDNALIWCRCNRSMRAFDATVAALAAGRQPAIDDINSVCYLMRNTGLDGNGTFGTKSFPSLGKDHALGGVLDAQMLTAYLMREFSGDLVEHLARMKSDRAVPLALEIRRYLGVGNGSALGLIFFIQKHARLINSWMESRERAISAACALELQPGDGCIGFLIELLERAIVFRTEDRLVYETFEDSHAVAASLRKIKPLLSEFAEHGTIEGAVFTYPLDQIARIAESRLTPESYETLLSLFIELVPEYADELAAGVAGADEFAVDGRMTAGELATLVDAEYAWALNTDTVTEKAIRFVWYKSETAEEPRRGDRQEIPEARDLGLDLPGDVQRLRADLAECHGQSRVAYFLLQHPEHRLIAARIQSLAGTHFHSAHANINDAEFIPIHLVHFMNAGIHGIDKTRDYLNRNLRGVLYDGAPTARDIREGCDEVWFYPPEPRP